MTVSELSKLLEALPPLAAIVAEDGMDPSDLSFVISVSPIEIRRGSSNIFELGFKTNTGFAAETRTIE